MAYYWGTGSAYEVSRNQPISFHHTPPLLSWVSRPRITIGCG